MGVDVELFNVALFNDDQIRILIFQQLLKLQATETSEGIHVTERGFDLEEFRLIVKRFGLDWDSIGPELPFDQGD